MDKLKKYLMKENNFKFLEKLSENTIKNIINDLKINDLKINEKQTLYIFSDGNVKNNGKKNARGGFSVYFGDQDPYNKFNRTRLDNKNPTNNKLELCGLKQIYKTIYKNQDYFKKTSNIICMDSQYSINCINVWSDKWSKNGWKNQKGEIVKNCELIKEILLIKELIDDNIEINMRHVYSHSKEPINKQSEEWILWHGNKKVDDNINEMLKNEI
jgi:ribonuclease HI